VEPMVFVHNASGSLLSIFADDLLLICEQARLEEIRATIGKNLSIVWGDALTDGSGWHRYLGRHWMCKDGEFYVRVPPSYWTDLLLEVGLDKCKTVETPGDVTADKNADETLLGPEDHAAYRRVIGKVMWGSLVRPDLTYIVKELARKLAAPTCADWAKVRRLMRYLRGTVDLVLRLTGHVVGMEAQSDGIDVYADANWASGPSRRSTSGGVLFYKNTLIMSWSRTQPTVTLSTAEAELTAMGVAVQEGQFLQHLLDELGHQAPLRLHSDSSAARAIVARRGVGRLKHLAVKDIWLQEQLREGRLTVQRVGTLDNYADLFTKVFAAPRHRVLADMIGLQPMTDELPKQ
jgi:hypothetical protein